ncbi:uncharacterized protein PG998_006578 [Apiospora kogelbergensis]|uniref:uncharacterized protein n=1 Tax=Apiospora kogelbergensis TaxID=1337665 RepID=UPI00312EA51E
MWSWKGDWLRRTNNGHERRHSIAWDFSIGTRADERRHRRGTGRDETVEQGNCYCECDAMDEGHGVDSGMGEGDSDSDWAGWNLRSAPTGACWCLLVLVLVLWLVAQDELRPSVFTFLHVMCSLCSLCSPLNRALFLSSFLPATHHRHLESHPAKSPPANAERR